MVVQIKVPWLFRCQPLNLLEGSVNRVAVTMIFTPVNVSRDLLSDCVPGEYLQEYKACSLSLPLRLGPRLGLYCLYGQCLSKAWTPGQMAQTSSCSCCLVALPFGAERSCPQHARHRQGGLVSSMFPALPPRPSDMLILGLVD